MNLSPQQTHELLSILERQTHVFVGTTLGKSFLSPSQIKELKDAGIDVDSLYDQSKDPVLLNYHLGLLSDVIGTKAAESITFDQLKRYVQSGQHIPLTQRERATIDSIKNQSLSDIRSIQGKIFQDINNVVTNESLSVRSAQEQFIKEQIIQGLERRESVKKISMNLAKLTGDWQRNFLRQVQYISHQALNEGRIAMISKRYEDGDGQVYFIVQPSACDSCRKAYLNRDGSPIIFTIKSLLANGSNIGRTQQQWLPTIGPLHPNCRCLVNEYKPGQQWKEGRFVMPMGELKPKVNRKKVRIIFNGQEFFV